MGKSRQRSSRLKRRGVCILVTGGPHKGESFDLEAGIVETIVIGSDPATKIGKAIRLKKDDDVHKTHVRLDFDAKNRKMTAVKVTDKSGFNGNTYVNRVAVK